MVFFCSPLKISISKCSPAFPQGAEHPVGVGALWGWRGPLEMKGAPQNRMQKSWSHSQRGLDQTLKRCSGEMRVSEWGDILSSSSSEDDEISAPAVKDPSFCVCRKCMECRAAGAPPPSSSSSSSSSEAPSTVAPPTTSGSASTKQPTNGGPSPTRAATQKPDSSTSSSSGFCSCAAAEGVPVSLMMLQYPLFFCDIDLPFTLELKRSWREIGRLAFWTLSSAKEGNGVEALRDNNSQTFWQSEGQAPHTITLQFNKEFRFSRVDLLVSLQQDESYTPKRVQIKLGSNAADMHVVRDLELALTEEQTCWWGIEITPMHALKLANGVADDAHDAEIEAILAQCGPSEFLSAACLQIAILSTHQQGRDTHVLLVVELILLLLLLLLLVVLLLLLMLMLLPHGGCEVRVYGPMEDGGVDGEGPDTAMPSRTTTAVHEDGLYGSDLLGMGERASPANTVPFTPSDSGRGWSQVYPANHMGEDPPS
ncbi:hypothetical protein ACSSS7_006013 [Eimeria intestinalis]